MENRITVKTPDHEDYDVILAEDFRTLPEHLRKMNLSPDKVCIISDTHTRPLYEAEIVSLLKEIYLDPFCFSFEAGEEHKNLESIEGLYDFLLENRFTRKSLLISLGGGVTGDMTGFAAATYRRGIPFVQIPTTLLSQVDASIGGKTGFDYHGYKNMIGAFHMPSLVYISTKTLETLPEREYISGLAENIKHGLIKDEKFYEWMLNRMDQIVSRDSRTVAEMIRRSLRIKQETVESDPTEKGLRMILNYGHTIGHAIEKAKDFRLTHGECVALGCIASAKISCDRGMLPQDELYELRDSCVGFGLPVFLDGTDTEKILELTKSDKKASDGHIRFILLGGIGNAVIADDVSDDEIRNGIQFINGDLLNGQ
ncbi:MAG: 3-dehydroquinate synthase [Lachnospiraceae bacterium]|jgi:3-dehydroquinate synthase|nr:3-dehydroquinate synthase [Lachnospiraceae bacterium]MCI1726696.1 3-dehydroquinate synthase [Lachnospiraceae bacterium]